MKCDGRSSFRSSPPLQSPPCTSQGQDEAGHPSYRHRGESWVSPPTNAQHELQSPIASLPTFNQPVLDTQLKEMLLMLHRSLHADFTNLTHKFSAELSMMGDRVNQVEDAITDITTTFNDLIAVNDDNKDERQWLRAKITDLEDHARQNNLN